MSERYLVEDLLGPLNECEKKKAPEELFVAGDEELLERGGRWSARDEPPTMVSRGQLAWHGFSSSAT